MKHPRLIKDLFTHHDSYQKVMQNIVASGDTSKAFLISGKKGIGKASFVYKICKELLNADNIENQTHPDFLSIERRKDDKTNKLKRDILIDDVRTVKGFLSLSSGFGGWRIVLIDSACEMNRNAGNMILKFLEEPPKKTLIFLLSHGRSILPTLRSRCQVVRLKRIASDDIKHILSENYEGLEQEQIRNITELAQGSANLACCLADEANFQLYQNTLTALNNTNIEFPELKKVADRITGNEDAMSIISSAINNFLDKKIKENKGIGKQTDMFAQPQEKTSKIDFIKLLSLKQSYYSELNEMRVFNLDQKAFVINKVAAISEALGAQY